MWSSSPTAPVINRFIRRASGELAETLWTLDAPLVSMHKEGQCQLPPERRLKYSVPLVSPARRLWLIIIALIDEGLRQSGAGY